MERLFPKEFLDRYGFDPPPWTAAQARAYTRWLAGGHYENFHVVSFLLPQRLRQDFFNVYAYCRWADDLGDELGDPSRALEALGWWRGELRAMYAGRSRHPVFVALAETVERHSVPEEPFEHLIRAFEADQRKTRYASYDEVLEYCVWSANPVGRLVLRLCGYADAERAALSDATCTALQLANHWQDVRLDYFERDRIYLPEDVLRQHGYGHGALVEDLLAGRGRAAGRGAVLDLVGRTRRLFEDGRPLAATVDRRLAIDLELFRSGGVRVLDKIERQGGDVFGRRPRIGAVEKAGLLVRVLLSRAFASAGDGGTARAAEESSR